MIKLNPITLKQWRRFKSIRRGYWSAIIFASLLLLTVFLELFVSNRALIVSYEGELYFPSYGAIIPGEKFGLNYQYETNYRDLKQSFKGTDNWLLLPPIPYEPLENHFIEGEFPPYAPSLEHRHYLGTDNTGRDIAARLIHGFRIAIWFSLLLLFFNYLIGVSVGSLMGFMGGKFDLFFQRIIEIWSNIPFLYVIMIIASIVVPGFWTLIGVMIIFGWMSMTWYMRTATYKENSRDYVMAARAIGATNTRIIFRHIMPNTISIMVTFIPFSIASGITALTALDYLGFGLPPPTPSWGELLKQGTDNLDAPWIIASVVTGMTLVLVMVTYIGEAIREAFDPKKFTTYE
ncbi:MAG: microcin C transport system permease protein [Oceanicoccus sp.]|jgi:microcin C transport system permease protein